jgi:mannose-1-phosphate guanylyltransferase
MKAVVLVGGFGTRLRPLTLTRPKQMLPLLDRPMLEHVIGALGTQGVTTAVLSLGYKPDVFTEAYPEGDCAGVALEYAVEPEPLDTAGAIRFAAAAANVDSTFLAVNGDVISEIPVADLLELHERAAATATIALTPVEDPSRFGVVVTDPAGKVEAFIEKPPAGEAPSNWINAGCYVMSPDVLEMIPADRPVSVERETFPQLVADGSLCAVGSDAYWLDCGTPDAYLQAHMDLISGRRGRPLTAVDPSATVDPQAQIDTAVVMAGARVGRARITNSVISAGASVEDGAEVDGSIVGPGGVVGTGAMVGGGSVIGDNAVVLAGEVLAGARRPDPNS